MAKNQYQFTKPDNWKVIRPEKYKDFSILSTESVPCIYGFAIEKTDGYDVVSMFDYGESSSEFIKDLDSELERLEKDNNDVSSINDYIKENASDYIISETTSMRPIFHKSAKIFDKNCYINIMEVITNIGKSYSLQIFVKLNKSLICLGSSVPSIKESSPFESVVKEYDYIGELINVIIRTLEEV